MFDPDNGRRHLTWAVWRFYGHRLHVWDGQKGAHGGAQAGQVGFELPVGAVGAVQHHEQPVLEMLAALPALVGIEPLDEGRGVEVGGGVRPAVRGRPDGRFVVEGDAVEEEIAETVAGVERGAYPRRFAKKMLYRACRPVVVPAVVVVRSFLNVSLFISETTRRLLLSLVASVHSHCWTERMRTTLIATTALHSAINHF